MNRHNITIKEAKQLPTGSMIKWLKDNKYYIKADDGVFDVQYAPPLSDTHCECLHGPIEGEPHTIRFCSLPCHTADPDDLYIVEA